MDLGRRADAMTERFIEHVGMRFQGASQGSSTCGLATQTFHLNGNGVIHGGVLFTLADTGMGYALLSTMTPEEMCATIEIKINYFKPVHGGELVCTSSTIHRGKSTANLDASIHVDGVLVAKANGTFAIFARKSSHTAQIPPIQG